LAPRKFGVPESWPFTKVKFTEQWCPSQRHPHVPAASGVPKMLK
jgi:hypothetical protein